jgi:hypothetical protein
LLMLYILFSFPSSPDFHKVFPQLQTCSTYMFVYDHVCLVYIFIFWIYFPHMKENMWPLSFWTWVTSVNVVSSNCIHLPSKKMESFFLMAE